MLLGLVLAWGALSAAVLAVAYLGGGAHLLGKRSDGSRSWSGYALILPMTGVLGMLRLLLKLLRHREPSFNQLDDTIYIGRIIKREQLPEDVKSVLDLTSEFIEDKRIRREFDYHTLPTLDGLAPDPQELAEVLRASAEWDKPIYIHCAAGHGRAALATTCLYAFRQKLTIEQSLTTLKSVRPLVHLSNHQYAVAEETLELLKESAR